MAAQSRGRGAAATGVLGLRKRALPNPEKNIVAFDRSSASACRRTAAYYCARRVRQAAHHALERVIVVVRDVAQTVGARREGLGVAQHREQVRN